MKLLITGHRPYKLGSLSDQETKRSLLEVQIDFFYNLYNESLTILTGMALGVDQWAAEFCINKNIPFEAYLAFSEQHSLWTPSEQSHYKNLLSKASKIHVISPSNTPHSYLKRDDLLAKDADFCIAIFNGDHHTGTGYTIRKVKSLNKQVITF